MGNKVKNNRVSFGQALQHLRHFHPGTPLEHAHRIAEGISRREWTGQTLGGVAGIALTSYARHVLTDYERLLRLPGVTRTDARNAVAGALQDVLRAWAWGPAPRLVLPRGAYELPSIDLLPPPRLRIVRVRIVSRLGEAVEATKREAIAASVDA